MSTIHQDEDECRREFEAQMNITKANEIVWERGVGNKYCLPYVQGCWHGWVNAWNYLKEQDKKEGGE
jgi:hypothetical protein